ncbi:MAG: DUF721 domain-containing protein [Caldisericaceae bacterium]
MKSSLDNLLKKREAYVKVKGTVTFLKWREVVGDGLAQYTKPIYYKDGVLYIGVTSSLFKNELESMKGEILNKIRNSTENSPIRDIKFKVSDSRFPKAQQVQSKAKNNFSSPPIKLNEKDVHWIEENVNRLKANDTLRLKYRKMLEAFKELEKKKEISGYKKCKKCGALFKGDGPLCPVCEMNDKKKR